MCVCVCSAGGRLELWFLNPQQWLWLRCFWISRREDHTEECLRLHRASFSLSEVVLRYGSIAQVTCFTGRDEADPCISTNAQINTDSYSHISILCYCKIKWIKPTKPPLTFAASSLELLFSSPFVLAPLSTLITKRTIHSRKSSHSIYAHSTDTYREKLRQMTRGTQATHFNRQRHLFTQTHTQLNTFNIINKATGQFRLFSMGGLGNRKRQRRGKSSVQTICASVSIHLLMYCMGVWSPSHISFVFLSMHLHTALSKARTGIKTKSAADEIASITHTPSPAPEHSRLSIFPARSHIHMDTLIHTFTHQCTHRHAAWPPEGHSPIERQVVKKLMNMKKKMLAFSL